MMYTITVLYIITSSFSLFFCNGFFVMFHIYQRKKEFSQQSNKNDDFLLSCIALTIQMGSIFSAGSLYAIIFGWQNQFLACFLLNARAVTSQIQLVCMLFFSLTRFAKIFFPQQISRMNHYLMEVLIKMWIILVPAYINFVMGHTCGLDSFCPKDFRNSYNLITYTEPMELKEQMVSLIIEHLECRKNWAEVIFPKFVAIILLLNLCIVAKELFRILHCFQTVTPSAPEAVELRTISGMMERAEASEDDEPQNNDDSDSYSVGMMTGVLTILLIFIGKVFTIISLHYKAGNLMYLIVELILNILIPILWFVGNTAIIRTEFVEPEQS